MFEQANYLHQMTQLHLKLMIWYRSNRSINTADLNALLEDLKKDGKQCVFLIT